MQTCVFDYLDYRAYLRASLPTTGAERGRRSKLASLLGCQNGFISSVFNSSAHFSAEHAIKVSHFLEHSAEERDFFLLLVAYNRAGAKDLEDYYYSKIQSLLEKRREVRARLPESTSLSETAQLTYYSSWHYIAVHMCLMIPGLNNKRAIARRLSLSQTAVERVLKFFYQNQLAAEEGDRIIAGSHRFHLPAHSPLVSKHHTNWRMKAIQSLDSDHPTDLHYSLVMSVSEDAAEKIRSLLLQTVQQTEPILKAAGDETLYSLNLDLFRI